ncbi:hypothetical protein NXC14_PA00048 (plasmid) [Rhizobium sp. NXC14]|nr:hypothetical protein NXC14_PA00048 [Rhizobium sp. NXC14]
MTCQLNLHPAATRASKDLGIAIGVGMKDSIHDVDQEVIYCQKRGKITPSLQSEPNM